MPGFLFYAIFCNLIEKMIPINWETIQYLGIGAIIGFIPSIIIFLLTWYKEKKYKKKEIVANLMELLPQMPIRRFQSHSDEYAIRYWNKRIGRETEVLYYEEAKKELERCKTSFLWTFEHDLQTFTLLNKYHFLFQRYFKKNSKFEELFSQIVNYKYDFPDLTNVNNIGELKNHKPDIISKKIDEQFKTSSLIDEIDEVLKKAQ
jgi:hypothetical protein